MTYNRVTELLGRYQFNKARISHLTLEIKYIKAHGIHGMEPTEMSTEVSTKTSTKVSKGSSIQTSTTTSTKTVTTPYHTIDQNIHIKTDMLNRARTEVAYVDIWLSGLCEKERFAVTQHTFLGKSWSQISDMWASQFGSPLTQDRIRKIYYEGIKTIHEIAM